MPMHLAYHKRIYTCTYNAHAPAHYEQVEDGREWVVGTMDLGLGVDLDALDFDFDSDDDSDDGEADDDDVSYSVLSTVGHSTFVQYRPFGHHKEGVIMTKNRVTGHHRP
jgi:hypothetical protein